MSRSCKASALIAVLLAVVIFTAPAVQAASWTSLRLDDYIENIYYEGNFRCVSYDFGITPFVKCRCSDTGYTTTSSTGSVLVVPSNDGQGFTFTAFPLGKDRIGGPPLSQGASGGIAIDVSDYHNDSYVTFSASIGLNLGFTYDSTDVQMDEDIHVSYEWMFAGYNSTGGYVGTICTNSTFTNITLQDQLETYYFDLPMALTMGLGSFDEPVYYIAPSCAVNFTVTDDNPDIIINYVEFECKHFSMRSRIDMLLVQSDTMNAIEKQLADLGDKVDQTNDKLDQTNDKLDDTNEKLDDTNEKLDEIIELPQKEKDEATQEGNKFVDQLTGAIPSDNQGFLDAISQLANSMSYEGTEAKLKLPAISLPAIPGVMKGYKLTDAQDIDFGVWIQKIPDNILTLVQVLGTLGLVVYSFKELYGMISYAMTLKGGRSDG